MQTTCKRRQETAISVVRSLAVCAARDDINAEPNKVMFPAGANCSRRAVDARERFISAALPLTLDTGKKWRNCEEMKQTDFNGPREEQLETAIWNLPHAIQKISWLAADITTSVVTVNLYAEDEQLKNAIRALAKNAWFADSQFSVLGNK